MQKLKTDNIIKNLNSSGQRKNDLRIAITYQ